MFLQKMRYDLKSKKTVICGINTMAHGGDYTFCGNVNSDGAISECDDFEAVGQRFIGKLKDVTCHKCKDIIEYVKSLT